MRFRRDRRPERDRQRTEDRRRPERTEPARNVLRTVGRVLLWGFVLLVFVRGVGDIMRGDPERAGHAQAGPGGAALSFPDDEARAFALQFARAYLTFTPRHPEYHEISVRPYLAQDLREDAALELPTRGPSQTVTSAAVARAQPAGRDRALVTVAATVLNRTITTRYLTVPVARDSHGGLVVFDYPSFSSPPPEGAVSSDPPAALSSGSAEIQDLLRRFFAAYLDAQSIDQLSYFLTRTANVTALAQRYQLREIVSFAQLGEGEGPHRTVLVTLRARDPDTSVSYTLRYRVELVRQDRWYVNEIEGGANAR